MIPLKSTKKERLFQYGISTLVPAGESKANAHAPLKQLILQSQFQLK